MKRFIIALALLQPLIGGAQQASDPKELSSLRDSYNKARTAATAPIDRKYVEALFVLKEKFTKSGNLDAAIATDTELKRIRGASPSSIPSDELPAAAGKTARSRKLYRDLVGTTWHTDWGDQTIVLEADGLMRFTKEAHNGKWQVSDDGKMQMFVSLTSTEARNTDLTEKLDQFLIPFGSPKICKRVLNPQTK